MLLGLHGRAQAGKDTVYRRIKELYPDVVVQRRAFADLLYESAAALLGVSIGELQDWKVDPCVSVRLYNRVPSNRPNRGSATHREEKVKEFSIRELLQRYGTEAHRDVFGSNFWTERLDLTHLGKIVCVTDVRFENEAARIRANRGTVVHVVTGPVLTEDTHPSEGGIAWYDGDYCLDNSERTDGFASLDAGLCKMVEQLSGVLSA